MKTKIATDKAPGAIGPYSQAIQIEDFVYLSGQIPLDPASGQLVGSSAATQAEQCLKNAKAILEAAGLGTGHVVKTTIFLKDMGSFAAVNEIYGKYFSEPYPARSTVEVARLPKDVLVEIEMIAHRRAG